MKIHKFHIGDSKGDTIVEVLIAISVVSLLLAGAYTSTRRSVNATRTAQEQGEALKLAESQVEQIKISIDSDKLNFAQGNFCLDPATGVPALPAGSSCSSGPIPYSVLTTHTLNSHDFVVKVTWPGLAGGTNTSELDYRAQP